MEAGTAFETRIKVLVVEDDLTIAGNLLEFLALHGHRADVAYDGPSAIAMLGAQGWDVIVLDIGLPRAVRIRVGVASSSCWRR